jgi:hypothetical protein
MFAAFDLGEFLGIGLDTTQIYYLAGALFLGLFGLSAMRHAKRAEGAIPIIWIAIAIALFGGCFVVVAKGFPDILPDWVKPWTETNRLVRVGAALALLGAALVLISGHWIRGAIARWICRVAGLALAGLAVWLAAGWFSNEVPDEVRQWTVDRVIARVVVILALVLLGVAFWMRQSFGTAHSRWFNRALAPAPLATGIFLAWRWFGSLVEIPMEARDIEQWIVIVAAIATGTCLLISAGAYAMRERPPRKQQPIESSPPKPAIKSSPRPLPVATLLDDTGRPVLPGSARGHSGPAGA